MDKVATKINRGQEDPIQNRKLSDQCWNGRHEWLKDDDGFGIGCPGYNNNGDGSICACACHNREPKHRVRKDKNANMTILESGCGTIEIK